MAYLDMQTNLEEENGEANALCIGQQELGFLKQERTVWKGLVWI